jgi:hypothetical protein
MPILTGDSKPIKLREVRLLDLGFTVLAVNTTAITDMTDTIILLLVAILPLVVFLAFWKIAKGGIF